MPQGNNVKSDILFSDTGWESPAVAQIIMSSIYHQKKNYIKREFGVSNCLTISKIFLISHKASEGSQLGI
ncbi:hypothetical protein CAPSP0001_0368 [Capnocytophaga sputigena ATCC 33612]|nr:hypothetical protein CAPSP0001_0368 [Capnocytophaga sputigena ATCC 33612]